MSYIQGFSDKQDVFEDFKCTQDEINFVDEIIIAKYETPCYEGTAYVLFKGTDGKFYEVYGNHCSCYSLEDQWDIEEVNADYYRERKDRGVKMTSYIFDEQDELEEEISKFFNL